MNRTESDATPNVANSVPKNAVKSVSEGAAAEAAPRPDTDAPAKPALPHERDESVGSTAALPSARAKQSHADVKRGVTDTSRAPEAGRA